MMTRDEYRAMLGRLAEQYKGTSVGAMTEMILSEPPEIESMPPDIKHRLYLMVYGLMKDDRVTFPPKSKSDIDTLVDWAYRRGQFAEAAA